VYYFASISNFHEFARSPALNQIDKFEFVWGWDLGHTSIGNKGVGRKISRRGRSTEKKTRPKKQNKKNKIEKWHH